MNNGNIFQNIPQNLDEEFFEILLQNDHIKIERIVSLGHTSPSSGWYDQDENEWVLVLSGEATIAFEDEEPVHLGAGSYLQIAARKKHKVIKTHATTETVWLAVHYE